MAQPIYSYNQRKVETRLTQAFRKRGREATIADLIAATGLPRLQIEETLPAVVHNYRGHLRVTESGEILYHFPHGLHHRELSGRARFERVFSRFLRGAAVVGKVLFKVWIMLMLVGYFVLFIALVVAALLASMAASAKSNGGSRGRSGSLGGTYMMTRLVQQIIFLWMFSGRRRGYGYSRGYSHGVGARRQEPLDWRMQRSKEDGPPLHQSIFAFVFGIQDPAGDWQTRERTAFTELVQTRKGVVTLTELQALTGRTSDEAQDLMNRMMLEYDGEPDVTEKGTLIYKFPELMRTAQPSDTRGGRIDRLLPERPEIPFNENSPGLNRWIGVLNGVNLAFGSYFTVFGLAGGLPEEGFGLFYTITVVLLGEVFLNPVSVVLIGLGFVPLVFSALFYLLPVVRNRRRCKRNKEIGMQNARRLVYRELLAAGAAAAGMPATGVPTAAEIDPEDITTGLKDRNEMQRVLEALNQIAGELQADVDAAAAADAGTEAGVAAVRYRYRFPDLARQVIDVNNLRAGIDTAQYRTGEVVFDSNE